MATDVEPFRRALHYINVLAISHGGFMSEGLRAVEL